MRHNYCKFSTCPGGNNLASERPGHLFISMNTQQIKHNDFLPVLNILFDFPNLICCASTELCFSIFQSKLTVFYHQPSSYKTKSYMS